MRVTESRQLGIPPLGEAGVCCKQSWYRAVSEKNQIRPELAVGLVKFYEKKRYHFVNTHHDIWESSNTNQRGGYFLQFSVTIN